MVMANAQARSRRARASVRVQAQRGPADARGEERRHGQRNDEPSGDSHVVCGEPKNILYQIWRRLAPTESATAKLPLKLSRFAVTGIPDLAVVRLSTLDHGPSTAGSATDSSPIRADLPASCTMFCNIVGANNSPDCRTPCIIALRRRSLHQPISLLHLIPRVAINCRGGVICQSSLGAVLAESRTGCPPSILPATSAAGLANRR